MRESIFTDFVLENNRDKIKLNVYIIDFGSNQNLKRFISTVAKILMAGELLNSNQKMVVFAGTYEKSQRISKWLNSLFTLVLERNTKIIPQTSGAFGFESRLSEFVRDKSKHLPVFEEFIKLNNIEISDIEKLKHKEIESIITMTSGRGVARTGVSLNSKSVGIYRFDDLLPVQERYSPVNRSVEDWIEPFKSDFTQLAGRIACLGNDPTFNKNRCVILARGSKISEGTEQVDWLRCLRLFESIPSISINNVYFCSYNAKTSIIDDKTYQSTDNDFVVNELNKNDVIRDMLGHLGISNLRSKSLKKDLYLSDLDLFPVKAKQQPELKDGLLVEFSKLEKQLIEKTQILVKKLKSILGEQAELNLIFATNPSHLFGCSSGKSITDFLIDELAIYKGSNEYNPELQSDLDNFREHLLERWVNDEIFTRSLDKRSRKRTSRISISIDRAVLSENNQEFAGSFTSVEIRELKKYLKSRIKYWDI